MITYRGQKFAGYNKPKATPGAPKKSAVLAKENGKVALVRFGDPKMSIKKHLPKNTSRHNMDFGAFLRSVTRVNPAACAICQRRSRKHRSIAPLCPLLSGNYAAPAWLRDGPTRVEVSP